ncbi:MAG: cytochrome P450 [Lasallia pustulata]|uniref:Cytochrome P450 n=1 Tax=Lasallia pustulata TaxID=136370 RepID=A0A5M8PXS3_9LECA|nr:MAG: cytochrome P450 [Lasallia pustulata]
MPEDPQSPFHARIIPPRSGASHTQLTVLALVLAYCFYRYVQKQIQYRSETAFGDRHGCLPMKAKIPFKWPLSLDLVKQTWDANTDQRLLAFYQQFFDNLGPNLEQKLLGGIGYVTIDPENIETLLSTKFQDFGLGSRRPAFMPFLGEGILTQDGSAAERSRDLLRRQFVRAQYQNLEGFSEHVDNLLACMSSSSSGAVDLQPLFFRFTLDTTTAFMFGQSIGSLKSDVLESFGSSFNEASLISSMRVRLSDFYWAYTPSRYSRACAVIKRYTDDYVNLALSEVKGHGADATSNRYVFIKELYEELHDPALVRDQLVNVLMAGRDSTACLMSWAFHLLLRHPQVLERVRREITSVVGDEQNLTRAHVRKLPYLKCVLDETLRLFPSAPINIRTSLRTTSFPRGGGPDGSSPVLIRKGMGIGYSIYHMHRRRDLYGEDAAIFRPERWEGSKLAHIGWGYLPFNGGPRTCLGKDFAAMEATYGIVRILQTFPNMRLPPGLQLEEVGMEKQALTLTVSIANGCKVQLY